MLPLAPTRRPRGIALLLAASSLVLGAGPVSAVLPGDLNGDGSVDTADEPHLGDAFGTGDADFDAAADLDGDGEITVGDLALFGVAFGQQGGEVDTTPPDLHVTLNDVPDDMNDLLVVPPEGFVVTILADSAGGSVVDPGSLQVTASEAFGALPPGSDLAPQFTTSPRRLAWEVPAGTDLARTSHYLTVSLRDAAGNLAQQTYGFAVRDFPFGPPMANAQVVFLDFDQDRSGGPEVDFIEDMRELGLSSAAAPDLETTTRDELVETIVLRAQRAYGHEPDGTPGADPVNVAFVSSAPAGTHARICVGGQSSTGGAYLGAVSLDVHNVNETQVSCGPSQGVFPSAIAVLWGDDAAFQTVFDALDPDRGGTPFGQNPLDPILAAPDFDLALATSEERARLSEVLGAMDAFSRVVANAIAHEAGHGFGLTAPGPAPAGLFGGEAGGGLDHNVTPGGQTPGENHLMNPGASFSFESFAGRGGFPLPTFRPLNAAYLRDRIVISPNVTGLFPPPVVSAVSPDPAVYPGPYTGMQITVHGADFFATTGPPLVQLITQGDPTPNRVQNVQVLDADTLVGSINPLSVPPALYDVRVTNPDGQGTVLVDGLLVQ